MAFPADKPYPVTFSQAPRRSHQPLTPARSSPVPPSLVNATLKALVASTAALSINARASCETEQGSIYKRNLPFAGPENSHLSATQHLIREVQTAAAQLFLHGQYCRRQARVISSEVCHRFTQRRQADIEWKRRLILSHINKFWHSAARKHSWPKAVGEFRAIYYPSASENLRSPSGRTPSNKRLRSPTTVSRSRADKKRRKSASTDELTYASTTARPLTLSIECLAFGSIKPRHESVSTIQTADDQPQAQVLLYALELLRQFITVALPMEDLSLPNEQAHLCSSKFREGRSGSAYSHTGLLLRPSLVSAAQRRPTLLYSNGSSDTQTHSVPSSRCFPGQRDLLRTAMRQSVGGSIFEHVCAAPRWRLSLDAAHPTMQSFTPPLASVLEVIAPSREASIGKPVTVDTIYLIDEAGNGACRAEKLSKPVPATSHLRLVSPWTSEDAALLMSTLSNVKLEVLTALRSLMRLSYMATLGPLQLDPASKAELVKYLSDQHKSRALEDEVVANFDEPLPTSPTAMYEFVTHSLLKTGQPEDWLRRHQSRPIVFRRVGGMAVPVPQGEVSLLPIDMVELGCQIQDVDIDIPLSSEFVHFLARRKVKDKRRVKGYSDRRNPFVLEHALQTSTTPAYFDASHRPPHVEQRRGSLQCHAVKLKSVAEPLPLWAVVYRVTSGSSDFNDVWENSAPLLTIFHLIGGSIVGPGSDMTEPLKRFLPPESVATPVLFARYVRSLQPAPSDPPPDTSMTTSNALAARLTKLKLSNPTPSDLIILTMDQLCIPVTVTIRAAQRVVRRLAVAWSPSEELFLWEAVTQNLGPEWLEGEEFQSLRALFVWLKQQCAEAVVAAKIVEGSSFLRLVNWFLIAYRLNTCLAPFDRAKSCDECKAKFVALLVEYAAGIFCEEKAIVNVVAHDKDIEKDIEKVNNDNTSESCVEAVQRSALLALRTDTEGLGRLAEDLGLNINISRIASHTRSQKHESMDLSLSCEQKSKVEFQAPSVLSEALGKTCTVMYSGLRQIRLCMIDAGSVTSGPSDAEAYELGSMLENLDNTTMPAPSESRFEVALDHSAIRLQASKMKTFFETQGIISASTLATLRHARADIARSEKSDVIASLRDCLRWSHLLNAGVVLNQLHRLARSVRASHDFTEKRRKSQQNANWLQESFVADRTLRLHIQSSQSCLLVLQSLRERMKARQPGQEVVSQAVYNTALRSYHRLLLPPNDSQRQSVNTGRALAEDLQACALAPEKLLQSEVEHFAFRSTSVTPVNDWSPLKALMVIARGARSRMRYSGKALNTVHILAHLYEARTSASVCPAQTQPLDMSKARFPSLRLVPSAMTRVVKPEEIAASAPTAIFAQPRSQSRNFPQSQWRPQEGAREFGRETHRESHRDMHRDAKRPSVRPLPVPTGKALPRRGATSPLVRERDSTSRNSPMDHSTPQWTAEMARAPPTYAPQPFLPPTQFQGWPPRAYSPANGGWPPPQNAYLSKTPFPLSAYTAPPPQPFQPRPPGFMRPPDQYYPHQWRPPPS